MISDPIDTNARHRYSDKEILALRDEVRSLGDRLDEVLDVLLDRVTARLQELEGIAHDDDTSGAIVAIESLRNEHRGTGGGSPGDHQPAESGE